MAKYLGNDLERRAHIAHARVQQMADSMGVGLVCNEKDSYFSLGVREYNVYIHPSVANGYTVIKALERGEFIRWSNVLGRYYVTTKENSVGIAPEWVEDSQSFLWHPWNPQRHNPRFVPAYSTPEAVYSTWLMTQEEDT